MELSALALNCTLKKSERISNTQALLDKAGALFADHAVAFDTIRVIDYNVPHGVSSDEGDGDEWPAIFERIVSADILIIGTPIWFGVRSSVCQKVIERLDASYDQADPETGQFPLYGKVAGVVVTGNEDGAHDAASNTLFNLTHLGCTVPPNVDSYWVGEAGPGPSYIEAQGERHLYTNKTCRYMVENLVWFAQLLKDNPIPTNLKELYEAAMAESGAPRETHFQRPDRS
jgi:multimeric flavodoxin WrbA